MLNRFLKFISRNFFKSFLGLIFTLILLFSYIAYKKVQSRTKLDKKITHETSVNFLVQSNLDELNIYSLYIELFPKQKKIALYFINPSIHIDEKKIETESIQFLKSKLESILDVKIEYLISIKEKDFYRIIDILGGLDIYTDLTVYKDDKELQKNSDLKLYSSGLKSFLKLKENPNPLDYLDRMVRQETISLSILDFLYTEKKQIPKEWIYFISNFFETNLNPNEIFFLFNYLSENKFSTSITEMSSEISEITKAKEKKQTLKINNEKVNITYNRFIADFKSDDFGDGEFSRIEILNGTDVAGLAKRAKNFLNEKRLKVLSTDNSPVSEVRESIIIDKSGNSEYVKKISEYLGIKKIRHAIHKDSGLDVTVILGEDFEIRKDKK